jgi:hypothetical protein
MAHAKRARATRRPASSLGLVAALTASALLVGSGFAVYAATSLRVDGATGSDLQVGSAPTVVTCPGDNGNGNGNAYGRCRNGNSDLLVTSTVPLSQ